MPSRASWDDTLGTGARQSRSNHRARICRDGLHRCDRICCRSHAHRQSRAAPSLPQPPEPEPQHAMRQARNQSSLAGSSGDGAVEKGGGEAGDGARGDGALWRRCGSVSGGAAAACSVLAVTMKVALALSPENAVEAPSSLTSRVRGTWPDRQLACMHRPRRPPKRVLRRDVTRQKAHIWSRSAVSLRPSRTFLV